MRKRWLTAAALAVALFSCSPIPKAFGRFLQADNAETGSLTGTVIDSVTHEGIRRALVYSPDNRFATMTDSEGHFEFKIPASSAGQNESGQSNRPYGLAARKPGYVDTGGGLVNLTPQTKDCVILLVAEAVIVGHVSFPSSETTEKIQVELYRRDVQQGRSHWVPAGGTSTRSNGEFRFADLAAGGYKVLTRELLDQDPLRIDPHQQVYGYPPTYFPAASNFDSAQTINISAGQTFLADITLVRQPYYPVKVEVAGANLSNEVSVTVSAQGGGPGYALGYSGESHSIVGMLPNGSYTVEAVSFGPNAASGSLHFTVKGSAAEGLRMTMVRGGSIRVNVKEEFTSNEAADPVRIVTGRISRDLPQGPRRYLSVYLRPADDYGNRPGVSLRNPEHAGDESMILEKVFPGRYWVQVNSAKGFASSVTSGAIDLRNEPLVVGTAEDSTIEITMRNDVAEVDGVVEGIAKSIEPQTMFTTRMSGASTGYVYMIPSLDGSGEFQERAVSPEGKFSFQRVPPGTYRVLAFDHAQTLEYHSAEAMRAYESSGQVVRVVGGQKQQLRLQVISTNE